MAKTAFATDNALTKKMWDEDLFRDVVKNSYFMSKLSGGTQSSCIYVKEELAKNKGDLINFGLRMRLTGAGVTGNTSLEGNEERLNTYNDSVSLQRYRHAIRDDGELTRQRAMFSIDQESQQALKDWGSEKIDELAFDALQGAFTRIAYRDGAATGAFKVTATASTAKTAMSATYKLDLNFFTLLSTYATTGGNRNFIPIKPLKVDGRSMLVFLTHPDALADLRMSSEFQQAMREAEVRGKSNPLFQDAAAVWGNVIIHTHENMEIANDGGGSTVAWAKGVLMGQQSLCWAWGKRPKTVHKKFDYDEEHGYAWAMTAGVKKPKFNSEDFGSLGVYVARTKISDL